VSGTEKLGTTNLGYASLFLSLLNEGPLYVVLASNLEVPTAP
jgi:hypothetical protein